MNPLVSIIIPIHNVSGYIERCVNSVISQTYDNIELVLVDDVSTDDSIEKCESIIAKYNGPITFKIIHHEVNGGSSASRNTGTKAASGDYLFYIDSDDDISPDCIEKMVSCVIEDEKIEMVQGNYLKICGEEKELGRSISVAINNNDDARDLFFSKRILNDFIWNKLLKKSFVISNGLYNREGIINQDLLWNYYLTKSLNKARILDDVTYYYRIRPGSIVTGSSKKKQGISYAIIYNEILDNLTLGKERGELYGFLFNFCYEIVSYKQYVPELKPVYRRYKESVRKYCPWYYSSMLSIANLLSRLGISPQLLQSLNKIRRKLTK